MCHLPKNRASFAITDAYSLRLSAVMCVAVRASSASSPMQYRSVETCFSSASTDRPEARRNCSKRFFQRGHSSGVRKLKAEGGCRRRLAMVGHF